MKFRNKLRLFLFPAILFPAVAAMAINFIITGSKIREMQYELLKDKVESVIDACDAEFEMINSLGMGNVEFYRKATEKLVIEEINGDTTGDGEIDIVDTRLGAIVFSTSPEEERFLRDRQIIDGMVSAKKGTGDYVLALDSGNPIAEMVAFGIYANWDWLVIAHASRDVAYRYLFDAISLSSLVVGLFVVAFSALIYHWSNGIVRSLQLLQAGAMRIAAHDYDVAIAIAENDEFGSLAGNFREMASEIRQAHGDLKIAVQNTEAANRELASSLRWNEAIIAAIPDLLLTFDRKGTLVACQAGDTERFLLKRPSPGDKVADVMPPAIAITTLGAITATLDDGEPRTFEYDLDGPGGHRWFELRVMRSAGDQALAIARDITDRKRAEEALRRSETLLNATQQLAKIGGWDWDVERQATFWTEETFRIHGYDPKVPGPESSEYIDNSLACYDPADRPVVYAAFQRCIKEGKAYSLEFPFTSVDGKRKWILTSATAVRAEDGRIVKVVGSIMDITDRKRSEEELRALNEELEERVRDRTTELNETNLELEKMNRFFVGRELRMKELKDKIAGLEGKPRREDMPL